MNSGKGVATSLGALLALWLDSTIHAHPFISESYWRDSVAVVRDVYLPAASTWVWEQDGELKGFVSVLDSLLINLKAQPGVVLFDFIQQRPGRIPAVTTAPAST